MLALRALSFLICLNSIGALRRRGRGDERRGSEAAPPPPAPAADGTFIQYRTEAQKPAVRAQFSQKFVDYISRELIPLLVTKAVPLISIPDLGGELLGFKWNIGNVRITNPRIERPKVRFAEGRGLGVELNGMGFDFRVSFSVEGTKFWNFLIKKRVDVSCQPTVSGSGFAELSASGGKPRLHLAQRPSVRIDMGRIDISGSLIGEVVQIVIGLFQGLVQDIVRGEIEKLVQDIVNKYVSDIVAMLELKVPIPVPPPFDNSELHFSVTGISAHKHHAAVDLGIALVDARRPNRVVSQPVKTRIPDIMDSSKMFGVSVVPEVIEDIVRFHQDKWSLELRKKDIPRESPLTLDTKTFDLVTTPSLTSIFGEESVKLTASLGAPVEVNFGNGSANVKLESVFKFDIERRNAKPSHAFTIVAALDGTGTLKFEVKPEQTFHAELQSLSFPPLRANGTHPKIKFVNALLLSPLLELLDELVIMPAINSLLGGGIACCEVDGFGGLQNTRLQFSGGAFSFFSNFDFDFEAILGLLGR